MAAERKVDRGATAVGCRLSGGAWTGRGLAGPRARGRAGGAAHRERRQPRPGGRRRGSAVGVPGARGRGGGGAGGPVLRRWTAPLPGRARRDPGDRHDGGGRPLKSTADERSDRGRQRTTASGGGA